MPKKTAKFLLWASATFSKGVCITAKRLNWRARPKHSPPHTNVLWPIAPQKLRRECVTYNLAPVRAPQEEGSSAKFEGPELEAHLHLHFSVF